MRVLPLVALAVLLPGALAAGGGAALVRVAYAPVALLVAVWLWRTDRPVYLGYLLVLFSGAPWLRRLVDLELGLSLFNLVLLAPYLACLPLLLTVFCHLDLRREPLGWIVVGLIACVAYALIPTLIAGRLVPGLLDAVRWVLPLSTAALILAHPKELDRFKQSIRSVLLIAMPATGIYGIYQYAALPPWDRYWLEALDIGSFGIAEPFSFRVFSTLNSPGSYGKYAMAGGLLLIADARPWALLAVLPALLGLMLAQIRAAWLAFAVGLILLLARARAGIWLGVAVVTLILAAGAAYLDLDRGFTEAFTGRVESLQDMESDTSFNARLQTYYWFIAELDDNLLGKGLAINATPINSAGGGASRDLDSGVIETFLVFGLFVGTTWFLVYGWLIAIAARTLLRPIDGFTAGAAVVVLVSAVHLWLGNPFHGETGMLFWPFVGVVLAEHRRGARA